LDTHTGDPSVLDLVTDGVGRYAWALQEKLKGCLPVLGYLGGGRYGGWGFADSVVVHKPTGTITYSNNTIPMDEANQLPSEQLKTQPFFNGDFDTTLFSATGGSNYAQLNRDKLLVEAFPALSLPAGGNAGDEMKRFGVGQTEVFDMQSKFQNGWAQERVEKGDTGWKHSDLRNISYLYIYKIFEKMVNLTGDMQ
jgi:hypothetical protein